MLSKPVFGSVIRVPVVYPLGSISGPMNSMTSGRPTLSIAAKSLYIGSLLSGDSWERAGLPKHSPEKVNLPVDPQR